MKMARDATIKAIEMVRNVIWMPRAHFRPLDRCFLGLVRTTSLIASVARVSCEACAFVGEIF